MERRLAAILAADVVGYSRLMEADEAGTFARLRSHRKDLFEPKIAEHNGRIFKLMGDGLLAEFGSVVDAVECAVALQREMAARNDGAPADQRIDVRMAVNLGDVIVEGEDRHGEGVNIAARLETLADPGGILISGTAFDQVRNKTKLRFDDLGTQALKNIAEPVRAYRIVDAAQAAAAAPAKPAEPGKPSLAVLPFNNMSGDPEQQYFSDGITEDIITELSRFRSLFVVARNSSFQYRDKATDVRRIGRELGAQYVVEGSVRKAGGRVRVSVQLIEAAGGNHLWAERYDRDLEDIFAVQDEVVRAISGTIPGQLDRVAVEHIRGKTPNSLTAYDCELRGRWAFAHWNEGLAVALEWFEKAVKADPDYALAHAGIAMACSYGLYVLGMPPETALARGREHARRATVLDDKNPTVNAYAALAYFLSGEHSLAKTHAKRAVSLNPNDSFTLYVQASVLSYAGEPEQALEWFARSERLDPYAPDDQRLDTICDCYYMLHDYEKVIEIHATYQNVPAFLYLILAAACAQAGQSEKARAAVEEYERLRPPEHDAATMIKYHVRMCARQEDRDHWLDGYRKAGIDV